jgi:hypothetical protein
MNRPLTMVSGTVRLAGEGSFAIIQGMRRR